jgi:arsenate reductase-like glutaredoxin family protein
MPFHLSAEINKDILLANNFNQTDALYFAMNSNPGVRQQVMDSLNTLQNKQSDIYNLLKGKASKAGARRIIQMIDDLSNNNIDKNDLNKAIKLLQQEFELLSKTLESLTKTLIDDIEKVSNSLITISSQTLPHQRIQILAEIKNEQKNIKERIAELNEQVQKITTKTSRNRQKEMSKLVGTQKEINNDYEEIQQLLEENKNIANRTLSFALLFFIMLTGAIGAWVYYYIYHQKQVKNEQYEHTRTIVKEQYERLLEQLYIEEHEDGRLTADDLKKMSERVKKKVIRQNWAKRKIEERPAFI